MSWLHLLLSTQLLWMQRSAWLSFYHALSLHMFPSHAFSSYKWQIICALTIANKIPMYCSCTPMVWWIIFSSTRFIVFTFLSSTLQDPSKHVFHLVTDKLNFGAMNMWFLLNPPGKATIHVENVDEFKWLNSSYCPVLRQLESATMKDYYFKAGHPNTLSFGASNLK